MKRFYLALHAHDGALISESHLNTPSYISRQALELLLSDVYEDLFMPAVNSDLKIDAFVHVMELSK